MTIQMILKIIPIQVISYFFFHQCLLDPFLNDISVHFDKFQTIICNLYIGVIIRIGRQMGSKLSINIETPPFNPSEWEYLPQEEAALEEQGIYRTLRHHTTGQKIDQYEMMWSSEQEFLYYLKSYNWRSRQPSVVQSRFLVHRNQQEICSYSYNASVYVEHVRLRLSDISDIPFPDNLYMLMQALEGYKAIYEHSKFFIVDENQICVDEQGCVKVWVNSDLSINYPAIIVDDHPRVSQEEMVEAVINLVADNTDPETEPQPSFKEYFLQKKSSKGKNFEEARALVFTYARLNNTEIPSRFEAIFNITQDDMDIKTFTQPSLTEGKQNENQYSGLRVGHPPIDEKKFYAQSLGMKQPILANTIYCSTNPTTNLMPPPPVPIQFSFGSKSKQQLLPRPLSPGQNYMPVPVESEIYWFGNSQIHSGASRFHSIYHNQPNPVHFNGLINTTHQSEHFDSKMQPASNLPPPPSQPAQNPRAVMSLAEMANQQVSYFVPNSKIQPIKRQPVNTQNMFTGVAHVQAQSYFLPKQRKCSTKLQNTIVEENANKEDEVKGNSPYGSQHSQMNQRDQFASIQGHNINLENSVKRDDHTNNINAIYQEEDGVVAKSLPIQGYPSLNKKQLSAMAHPNKAVLSHIEPSAINPISLTFGDRSQLKDKFSSIKPVKHSVKPIKYFYNLYEELEIDPVIAADLAKLS